MVYSHTSKLGTSVHPRTGAPLGCDQSCIQPQRQMKKKAQFTLDMMSQISLLVQAQLRVVQQLA